MRLCQILLKENGRRPAKEPFPFKTNRTLALRSQVSGRNSSVGERCCIQEMTILMSCLKENEFQQSPCSTEIMKFQNCVKDFKEKQAIREMNEKKGITVTGERHLTAKQVNALLQKFP